MFVLDPLTKRTLSGRLITQVLRLLLALLQTLDAHRTWIMPANENDHSIIMYIPPLSVEDPHSDIVLVPLQEPIIGASMAMMAYALVRVCSEHI